jgi:zeta-carotene desaturase
VSAQTQYGTAATVGIIGGGLAGLAAGCALANAGYRVTLFERKPYLGGRASSYEHPGTGETVDNCQHILLGCCTNLIDFYRRLGVEDRIRWYNRLTFILPGGKQGELAASALPAPFHASPSFTRFGLLSLIDKALIGRAMLALVEGVPQDSGSFLDWLERHGQNKTALDRFWSPVLVSALNEELDNVSVHYGAMVFRDAFLKSAEAGRMGVPTVPLSELYGHAADYIQARGGQIQYRSSVESFHAEDEYACVHVNGEECRFDYVITAVPQIALEKLLPDDFASDPIRSRLQEFQTSPITGIHLWLDREITKLDHAVLLERTIQWMFQKSRILSGRQGTGGPLAAGSYLELVVSSSRNLVNMGRMEIIDLALRELAEFFPSVKESRLLKATVVKEIHATFSPRPGLDAYRPGPSTPWPRIFLSGDWTDTGWPATMEGAVRAGYLSAESLTRKHGRGTSFLVPDLPAKGLMRIFR